MKTALIESALGQVLEDALERVVERLDAEEPTSEPLRDGGQRTRWSVRDVAAADAQAALRVDLDRLDRLDLEQPGGERPRVRRVDADDERPVVQLLPDRARQSPLAASLPPTIRWMRSASSSTSSRMWEDTRIVRPSAPSRRITSRR